MLDLIYTLMLGISILSALFLGRGQALGSAALEGAAEGIRMTWLLAGPMLLFSGLNRLMDRTGITAVLAKILGPLLSRCFPRMQEDPILAGHITSNFCANLLGLGNAATPRGIQAAKRLKQGSAANDELCRLVVLNTASIQLIPTSTAAIRAGLHCSSPLDILPAVLITSFCSAGLGLTAAWILGRIWPHD